MFRTGVDVMIHSVPCKPLDPLVRQAGNKGIGMFVSSEIPLTYLRLFRDFDFAKPT
jgi:hypothetical protein